MAHGIFTLLSYPGSNGFISHDPNASMLRFGQQTRGYVGLAHLRTGSDDHQPHGAGHTAVSLKIPEYPARNFLMTSSSLASFEINLDFQRAERVGFDEAILCQGKAAEHLERILEQASERGVSLLLTRLAREQVDVLPPHQRNHLDYEPLSRTAYFGAIAPAIAPSRVALVSAGTSDAFVTREISRTLLYYGQSSTPFLDVGLAGAWRLLERIEEIRTFPVVIVVAGMDAALPTVVGGLVGSPIIAVPTSNGYGVSAGGKTALGSILASCSPGLMATNIDNGYGAACAALRILRLLDRSARALPPP